MHYFRPARTGQRIVAVPGEGQDVPVWILGSSLYGAHLAAALGLPYAFASHFAPAQLDAAVATYRAEFQPSEQLQQPYVMAGVTVIAAESDDEARFLATSLEQAVIRLRTGRPGRLQPPKSGLEWGPAERAILDGFLGCSAIGSPETVRRKLAAIEERTRADELIIATQIFDPAKRLRSYEITAPGS
jgi:luciferase family oxidoreductase group 1